ncbi:hypothetical protein EUTSA_v10015730mg, partial [Eutrema salsugineum]
MDRKGKEKQVAGTDSSSGGKKRKGGVLFRDESFSKRRTPEVTQFFEESGEVGYYGGRALILSHLMVCLCYYLVKYLEDEPGVEANGEDDNAKQGSSSFVFPKEEYDRFMEERYKPGSGFVRYADDDVKSSIEMDALVPTAKDPPLWKVKCAIGRETHLVFCLMHKFVELRKIATKLHILSVFSVEHVKGFIFIEADKEQDVLEACKSLHGIHATRMTLLPKAEAPHLLTVQRKAKKLAEGTWARIKSGTYKGDLAQVVAVNDTRGKALIKLIPRIDMAALTQKYGGGVAVQKGLNPAPRLISPSELEEFRPIIQVKGDRDTGINFEHLDSLMLKDGFLHKKLSLDSLSWGVVPPREEILKFTPVEQKEPGDVYVRGKGEGSECGKGEGSSESKSESSYELYNLVCFSRKDFGLIVGVDDKGDGYKVLKEGSDVPVVVSVGKKEMQNGPFDSKFSALDMNNKQISISDVVKISKGPSEGKQGVVRQVYRGIIFLYAESEEDNGGYFCCKSQACEKIKLFTDESNEKTDGFDASAFGGIAPSPESPLSPEKEWQPKEKHINSNQGDKGSIWYLCRVIALRYPDVTVKLDAQHKILTVKSEHLARNTFLRTRSAWGSKPTSDRMSSFLTLHSQQPTDPDDNSSTWANATAENKPASAGDQSVGLNSWGKTPAPEASTAGGWGDAGASKSEASSWGKRGATASNVEDLGSWGKHGESSGGNKQDEDSRWGKLVGDSEATQKKEESSWGKKVGSDSGSGKRKGESSWGNKDGNSRASNKEGVSWGQQDTGSDGNQGGSAWGNQGGGFGSGKSGWNKSAEDAKASSNKDKDDGGSSWGKNDVGGFSWGKQDSGLGGSYWCKQNDTSGGSSLGKQKDTSGGSNLGRRGGGSVGYSSLFKQTEAGGGSSSGNLDSGRGDSDGASWELPKTTAKSNNMAKDKRPA